MEYFDAISAFGDTKTLISDDESEASSSEGEKSNKLMKMKTCFCIETTYVVC